MQTKKGFILIYTLLVGIICLIIMMYIFDIQMSEVEYSTNNKSDVLKDDNYQRDNEYLMTLFFAHINVDTNKTLIENAFLKDSKDTIVVHDAAKVSYAGSDNQIIFTTPYEIIKGVYGYRNDYYKLEEATSGFNIIFIRTEYMN